MSSPKSSAIKQANLQTQRLANEGYGLALPAIREQYKDLNTAMQSGGEPGFVSEAYKGARGGILEGAALSQQAQRNDQVRQGQRARAGGSFTASIGPEMAGSKLAQALYGTRVTQAAGKIEEQDKLMGMALGQSGQTGSAAMQATGTQLNNIGYMQPYNSTYANVLGALNTAGSIYGAGKQQGWFSGAPTGDGVGFSG
jgi:hypothetical protein